MPALKWWEQPERFPEWKLTLDVERAGGVQRIKGRRTYKERRDLYDVYLQGQTGVLLLPSELTHKLADFDQVWGDRCIGELTDTQLKLFRQALRIVT